MKDRIVTVFGGTGFLGSRIVRHLRAAGVSVRIASRHPDRVRVQFGNADPELEAIEADVHSEESVASAVADAYGVVNAVSLYVERGKETFEAVHVEGAARLARLCRETGVERLVHVSGIGADADSSSHYIRARGEGEVKVREEYPGVTLIRPAVMFGPDDAFLTTLVRLVKMLPVYPLFGNGRTRLQPAYVDDVGEAISRLLGEPRSAGAIYELAGPRVYTYRALLEEIAARLKLRRRFLPVPFAAWRLIATISERLPGAGLTRNQVELMERDNVPSGDLPGLHELRIDPTPIEKVLAQISAEMKSGRGP
jgi:uncharacterized protein YbjT (DUF2867 family)